MFGKNIDFTIKKKRGLKCKLNDTDYNKIVNILTNDGTLKDAQEEL